MDVIEKRRNFSKNLLLDHKYNFTKQISSIYLGHSYINPPSLKVQNSNHSTMYHNINLGSQPSNKILSKIITGTQSLKIFHQSNLKINNFLILAIESEIYCKKNS